MLRFRLRTLLIAIAVLGVGLGWLAYERRQIAERRDELAAHGFSVVSGSVLPSWHSWLVGDDDPKHATAVFADHTRVTDAGIAHLKGLTQMKGLGLDYCRITDAELAHLKDLTQLQRLTLRGKEITDARLANVEGLTQLEFLWLGDCQVTDAGLVHLKGLTRLEHLYLVDTKVTHSGVVELQRALPKTQMIHSKP
jgi:Leucine-rich repeat (LRR) protein